jgi:hypothetical protein
MDPNKILEIAEEIKNSVRRDKTEYYKTKYSSFEKEYPILFKVCCDPNSDIAQLRFMISMLKNIQSNQMTEHVASVNVGQTLFDRYVKPNLDNIPPPSSS